MPGYIIPGTPLYLKFKAPGKSGGLEYFMILLKNYRTITNLNAALSGPAEASKK